MLHRDYILRMIEQVVKTLLHVVALRKRGESAEATRQIENAYRQALGCRTEFIASLSAAEMVDMMRSGIFNKEQIVLAARLIQEQAGLDHPDNEEAQTPALGKSLHLYFVGFADGGCPALEEYKNEIAGLLARIPHDNLTVECLLAANQYFLEKRDLAKAETLLFRAAGRSAAVAEHGRRFYDFLDSLPDAELEAGGLPRDEVLQGRADFEILVRETLLGTHT